MRQAEAVQRGLIALIAPGDGKLLFFFTAEIGRVHRGPDNLTPVARKVACGAAETVPFVRVTNLARFLRSLQDQGVWLIGTAGEADATLYQADFKGPVALVMGAEGKGMRRLTREHCDQLINIPMLGHVDSLNVSVATGVCLYEALRQRLG